LAGKYCCFRCPNEDYTLHELEDTCPTCGKQYDFPLQQVPSKVRDYYDLKPIARGFYGVTYEGKAGSLARPVLLKVIPIDVYKHFNKDFRKECLTHKEVSDGTEHLVDIMDAFDEEVDFQGEKLHCHVAELQYVPGDDLDTFLDNKDNCNSHAIAQIARDLFTLLAELERKKRFHNDLHAKNIRIQRLPEGSYRAMAIDSTLRAVAIDLGSVSDTRACSH